jgi:hypothetical protein
MPEINLSINCDINTLLDQIGKAYNTVVKRSGITSISPNGNDRFVSVLNGDQVIAAYFHPTKRHYATAEGKTKPGRSYADAGKWAVALVQRSLIGGNKTYYGTV